MQEVSRKRPHLGDSEPLPSKKRAVSVNCTTVPVNGTVLPTAAADAVDEEPRDQDDLEVDFIPFFFSPYPFLHSLSLLLSNSARKLSSAA